MNQEKLFNEWNKTADKLKNLSSFFQNDFDLLISDGHISETDLPKIFQDFNQQYLSIMVEFNNIRSGLINICYSDEYLKTHTPVNREG